MSRNSWRRRTPPRSRPGGVADTSKTPSLRACRRLARPHLDDAGIHQQLRDTPSVGPVTRDLDVVLVGATGFTGTLAAEHLARAAPTDLRWALAGRSAQRLAALRGRLGALEPRMADLELVVVDSHDDSALRALAERSRVVIAAVGPYLEHGDPLVAACAAAGTDYVDLTGEPEFVDRT